MTKSDHAMYQVTLKILLQRNNTWLALYTPDGFIDFPGGRVNESEYDTPFAEAIQRELSEELGVADVSVKDLAFVCKRAYTFTGTVHHVLAIYYTAEIKSGDIELSNEHSKHAWLTAEQILAHRPEQFVSLDEYEQMTTYFRKLSA